MGFFTGLIAKLASWGIEFGPRPPIGVLALKVADLHQIRELLSAGETVVVTWGAPWIRSRGQIYLEGVVDALEMAGYQPNVDPDDKPVDLYGDAAVITRWCLDRAARD